MIWLLLNGQRHLWMEASFGLDYLFSTPGYGLALVDKDPASQGKKADSFGFSPLNYLLLRSGPLSLGVKSWPSLANQKICFDILIISGQYPVKEKKIQQRNKGFHG